MNNIALFCLQMCDCSLGYSTMLFSNKQHSNRLEHSWTEKKCMLLKQHRLECSISKSSLPKLGIHTQTNPPFLSRKAFHVSISLENWVDPNFEIPKGWTPQLTNQHTIGYPWVFRINLTALQDWLSKGHTSQFFKFWI